MADDEVKLPRVPEALLKRRKQTAVGKSKSIKADAANRKKQRSKKRVVFQRAEKFVKEYRARERDHIRLVRLAKRHVISSSVPTEPKLALVIRISGTNSLHPQPKKVMQLLKLRQINSATFIRLNKTVVSLLKIAEPYVAWGIPSLKTVKELLYKRGHGMINKKKISLTDNTVIEKELGSMDIICMEDLVHEIMTGGPNFKFVLNFLWPFKLTSPLGGWKRKYRHFNDGGDFGYRGSLIDELVKQMI